MIVGNPPFAGHVTNVEAHFQGYTDFLRNMFPETGGKCDLVAFFFRRAFQLLREFGTFGLIATNTIRQGDTRESGLQWICNHGGLIYRATTRLRWPGQAAVIVSVVHMMRGSTEIKKSLNGRNTDEITAFLFHAGGNNNPHKLARNGHLVFQGSVIRGVGFTFDDEGGDSTTPLAEMQKLVRLHPNYSKIIYPYIGGEEVNAHPSHLHHRYVINFGEMDEEEAKQYPELFGIVRSKVLPARIASKAESSSGRIVEKFWQFGHLAKDLYETIANQSRVLAMSRVSTRFALTFLPGKTVFADTVYVFAFDQFSAFALLQSQVHEFWARFFSSSMKDDLRYTPTECFETFPLPDRGVTNALLQDAGRQCFEFRSDLMIENGQGLTATYNRFHNPEDDASEIVRLRELHQAMDISALDAYGWTDIQPKCEFIPEFDDEDEEDENGRPRKKKYRYRWPDEIRDEVLARLLELNRQRALEEGRLIAADAESPKPKNGSKSKSAKKSKAVSAGALFAAESAKE